MPNRETVPPLAPGRVGPQRSGAVASALDTRTRCGGPLCTECLLGHCPSPTRSLSSICHINHTPVSS